ncbi:MAG: hypothetical protein NTW50_02380 [Candidatus Berkelbacteria bacterium]|nr:hypothetical protein [Candidatus Berkelbacteria bacterium]
MKQNSIILLYRSNKTVFSVKDLALMWQVNNPNYLKTKINRLIKTGKIYFIRKGFYSLDNNYDKIELANKMIIPSYLGLYSVLAKEGVNFQYDSRIYSVTNQSRTINVENTSYIYRKIADSALLNPIGLNFLGNKTIATKERTIADTLYLSPDFTFDKLVDVDWTLCLQIAKIYKSKKLILQIKKLKEDNA